MPRQMVWRYAVSQIPSFRKKFQKLVRDSSLEATCFPGFWMSKGKHLGVQPHTADGVKSRSVLGVADYRMINILHVHPDLMFSTRVQVDLQEGKRTVTF